MIIKGYHCVLLKSSIKCRLNKQVLFMQNVAWIEPRAIREEACDFQYLTLTLFIERRYENYP